MTSCLNNDVGYGLVHVLEWHSEARGKTGFILDKGGRSSMTIGEFLMNDMVLVILWRSNEHIFLLSILPVSEPASDEALQKVKFRWRTLSCFSSFTNNHQS